MNNCEEHKPLISGLIDGELTPEEAIGLNQHLTRCPNCRNEYEKLLADAGKLKSVSFIEPEDEVLESLWKSPFHRFTRNAGLLLVIGGYLLLLLFFLWQFLFHIDFKDILDPETDTAVELAVTAIIIGFLILLLNVIRERRKTWKHDPYKHIKR